MARFATARPRHDENAAAAMSVSEDQSVGRLPSVQLYGAVVAGSTLIAIGMTLAFPDFHSFWMNWLYSQCIGLSTVSLIKLAHFGLWRNREPSEWINLLVTLVASVGGFLGGVNIAGLLLGHAPFSLMRWIENDHLVRVVFISALASLTYHVGFMYQRHIATLKFSAATEKARAEAAQRQATEAQLGMLRAQIEPHMLFNTLANLRALISIDALEAQRMLDRLISFMRATLSATRQERVPLHAEFSLIDDYLQLVRVRFGERLQFFLHLPDEIRELSVLPLLLQPIIENAVRHGIEPSIDGGQLAVDARRDGDQLLIHIRNSGAPYRTANSASSVPGGFGLAQIRERLATAYGPMASLDIGPLDQTLDLQLFRQQMTSSSDAPPERSTSPMTASQTGACVRLSLPHVQLTNPQSS